MGFKQSSTQPALYYYESQPTLMFWSKTLPNPSVEFSVKDTFRLTDIFKKDTSINDNAFDINAVVQKGPSLGYLLFVSRDVHGNTAALTKLKTALNTSLTRTPYLTSFAWVQVHADYSVGTVTPLYITTWAVIAPPKMTIEVRIEKEAVLGYNTQDPWQGNRPARPNQPLNLPLKPKWTLHPHEKGDDYVGFWLTYPSEGIPGAAPPQPMPGHNLYLSMTDTPGCGCLTWQGIEYFSAYYFGYDYLLDPLHRDRTTKTANGTFFKLKPTGSEPAYALDMLT